MIGQKLVTAHSAVAFLLFVRPALASDDAKAAGDPFVPVDIVEEPPPGLVWNPAWPKFSIIEYVVLAVTAGGAIGINSIIVSPPNHFEGGILFDNDVRSALRAKSETGRVAAGRVSDVLYIGLSVYPVIIDPLVAYLAGGESAAWELAMISAEAQAVSAFLSLLSLNLVGRERPLGTECDANPSYDETCDTPAQYLSFFSGHTTASFASAGLICAHHSNLKFYGGPWDTIACAGSVVGASTVGLLRMVADRHWATDVIPGAVIGFSLGYFIPTLFHYTTDEEDETTSAMILPGALGADVGLSLNYTF